MFAVSIIIILLNKDRIMYLWTCTHHPTQHDQQQHKAGRMKKRPKREKEKKTGNPKLKLSEAFVHTAVPLRKRETERAKHPHKQMMSPFKVFIQAQFPSYLPTTRSSLSSCHASIVATLCKPRSTAGEKNGIIWVEMERQSINMRHSLHQS